MKKKILKNALKSTVVCVIKCQSFKHVFIINGFKVLFEKKNAIN